jgi:hypothetical protein
VRYTTTYIGKAEKRERNRLWTEAIEATYTAELDVGEKKTAPLFFVYLNVAV